MTSKLFGVLFVTAASTLVACGGSIAPERSPDEPGTVATAVPSSTSTSTPPTPPSTPPSVGVTGNALEYFHRGAANLAIDHQRAQFAIVQQLASSDSRYDTCGAYRGGSDFGPGTKLDIAPNVLYPSSFGGGMAVTEVRVKSLDEALVLHVTLVNGTELDDTWQRGLGTQCSGDCVPEPAACTFPE
jgi:hypothetical protein